MQLIVVKKSAIAGLGGFAGRPIKKGEIIGEYTGEIISDEEADRRYENEEMTYLFTLENGRCIDAMHDPNPVKYINHSCDPNCEAEQDGDKIVYQALRDIAQDEELTIDYELVTDPDEEDPCTCVCGTSRCRGTMKAPVKEST